VKKKHANNIPRPTVDRLTMYLAHMRGLRKKEIEWVQSQQIADALCLTSSTVRQDLTYLDFSGVSKRGYETEKLERVLNKELGANKTTNMAVVGAGNLGRALALHGEFKRNGLMICAVFDSSPGIIGRKIGNLEVKAMTELPNVIRKMKIDIGIIAVPASSAQEAANALVSAGLCGLLNLAPVHVCVPEHVATVEARIIPNLQELLHLMKNPKTPGGKGTKSKGAKGDKRVNPNGKRG